ncbi:hypothetical protein A4212_04305 [Pasteurella multocida]|uniref:hypothetical protein n=1 Tax=Pasteurella multocida TaxID=747 RepID=UPI00094B2C8D|nr:hypothetical protein [Pasteurella multocida]AUK44456.1 hypothetical protein A4212_04305 [Pasteurella multocida]MDY0506267.1 hypothetical protein [Pasteurella multocida]HDR1103118.1 hypothetical protein [Pasteurella multocida]HDR1127142.1 hypothetical protein [Pasteurella multocida]HDR1165451.1 hypothetical protein [Pasteurella multocida]
MKAKQITVISLTSYIEDKAAAEYINNAIAGSIGATAFNAKDEERIIQALEDEIASCDESIKKNLKIEIEEVEIDE